MLDGDSWLTSDLIRYFPDSMTDQHLNRVPSSRLPSVITESVNCDLQTARTLRHPISKTQFGSNRNAENAINHLNRVINCDSRVLSVSGYNQRTTRGLIAAGSELTTGFSSANHSSSSISCF